MTPREAKLQAHRVFMARLTVSNMLMESAELALFAFTGTIAPWIAGLFFVVSVGVSLAVYAFFRFGYNLRLADKDQMTAQLAINAGIQIAFLLIAPQLAVLFLLVLVVLAGYAVINYTPRQFTVGWLVYGAVTGGALWLVRDDFGYPGTSGVEIVLVWLFFFMTLRSLILASVRFTNLRDRLSTKNRQLEESLRKIEELASRDHLTGVLNRGHFMEMLELELRRSERTGEPFCFAMLDLDLFKQINDRHGHPVGDAVLKTICEIATNTLRATDRMGRLGGEEFALILPGATQEAGAASLERLRAAVDAYSWDDIAPGLRVSFSAGIGCRQVGDGMLELIKRTDDALYRAKHGGRNRVMFADGEASPAL